MIEIFEMANRGPIPKRATWRRSNLRFFAPLIVVIPYVGYVLNYHFDEHNKRRTEKLASNRERDAILKSLADKAAKE